LSMPFEPWHEIICPSLEEASAVLLGLPFDGAACARRGAAQAPARIRMLSGLPTRFNEDGLEPRHFKLFDAGDLPFPSGKPGKEDGGSRETEAGAAEQATATETIEAAADRAGGVKADPGAVCREDEVLHYFAAAEGRALELLHSGRFCLFLGGDHSVSIPLVRAFARAYAGKKLGLLHFDAHPDLLDAYEGRTWSHACTQRRSLEVEGIGPGDMALIGVRSFMAEEAAFLAAHPEMAVIRVREISRRGAAVVAQEIIARFRDYDSLYMTIDIDVLDPAYAPGTGTPDAGGLSTRELLELVRGIAGALPVKAADVVEVSPPLDTGDITSLAALKVIYELLAAVLLREEKKS